MTAAHDRGIPGNLSYMTPQPARIGAAVMAALLVASACSSGGESACSKLRKRLAHVDSQFSDEAAQSWDDVMRGQELQQERGEIRGEMARRGCD